MLVCENIDSEIEIPHEGILSKPLLRDEHLKVVLFWVFCWTRAE